MTAEPNVTVRVTRRFEASAERVFDAWLDPEKAGKWLFATPSGQMIHAKIDARVGGSFCFVDRRDGEDVEHRGEYLELVRPRRLVFTLFVGKYSSDTSRVIIQITPLGTGCELTLTHEKVPRDYASRTESGWADILEDLATTLALESDGRDRIGADGDPTPAPRRSHQAKGACPCCTWSS